MEEQISTVQKLINTLIEFFVNYSFQVFGAIIVLIVGTLIAKWIGKLVFALCTKRKLDITLSKFLVTTAKALVLAFAFIIALGKFGITIAPFVAALGAVAFGATYAVQGPLSNCGAGFSIIMGRPFVVGDTVTVVGVSGVVQEVKLGSTILLTEDGITITVPNKHIVGEILQNSKGNRLVESVVGISYDNDPDEAIRTIRQVLAQSHGVQSTPPAQIGIQQFGDSSVNISYRYWVPTLQYFQISSEVNLAVFKTLQTAHITIPFPQREVRIISEPVNS